MKNENIRRCSSNSNKGSKLSHDPFFEKNFKKDKDNNKLLGKINY